MQKERNGRGGRERMEGGKEERKGKQRNRAQTTLVYQMVKSYMEELT